ncbi:MAG: FlgD immunoglobulin-like domain containing protein, partial [Bacteroidota bacterium]|nr:FlgD immunoglobulin-like domain containing protein [Bacteroidota bacterium]
FYYLYYISSKPTLGYENNFEGVGQTLTGHIYNKDNKPVTSYTSNFVCFEIHSPLILHPDGTYTTTIYEVTYPPDSVFVNGLLISRIGFDYLNQRLPIDSIYFTYSSHDEILVKDIHLKSNDYVLTGIKNNEVPENKELTLLNYPNPFNSSTNFFVKLPGSMRERPANIHIYNSNGRLVKSIQAKDGASSFWDGKDSEGNLVSSGRYYYQLRVEGSVLKSGSMIMLK